MTTSFMNALSLSKSTPRNSQGNKLWARLIASTTRLPSRLTSGRHSVHPVATSTILDERARYRRAAMRYHVDLAEAGHWVLPVVERPDRHLAADRGVEAAGLGDDLGAAAVIRADDGSEVLGVEFSGERRRADEITEHNGELAALGRVQRARRRRMPRAQRPQRLLYPRP